jgi:D-alanyl-D-alanine carboxypeptidase
MPPAGRPLALASIANDARPPASIPAYAPTTTPSAPRWSVASKLAQVAAERNDEQAGNDGAPPAGKTYSDKLTSQDIVGAPRPPARPAEAQKAVLAKLEPARTGAAERPRAEAKADAPKGRMQKALTGRLPDDAPTASIPDRPKASSRLGWVIQLGALPEQDKADDMLRRAKNSAGVLAKAESFTEKVSKGGSTLFRARFAGFDEDSAQSACRALKRNGFACFATRG